MFDKHLSKSDRSQELRLRRETLVELSDEAASQVYGGNAAGSSTKQAEKEIKLWVQPPSRH